MVEVPDNRMLASLAGRLLADAAFVFAEPCATFEPRSPSLYLASIALTGSERWELLLVAEAELAKCLAANLLGIDEDAEEARHSSAEALAELANIVAGSVAAECKDGHHGCRIGVPRVSDETLARAAACLGDAPRRVNLVTESGQHLAIALKRLEVS